MRTLFALVVIGAPRSPGFAADSPISCSVMSYGPIQLMLIDPQGKRCGRTKPSENFQEIPACSITTEYPITCPDCPDYTDEEIREFEIDVNRQGSVDDVSTGTWTLQATGSKDGKFRLSLSCDSEGVFKKLLSVGQMTLKDTGPDEDIKVGEVKKYPFTITSSTLKTKD